MNLKPFLLFGSLLLLNSQLIQAAGLLLPDRGLRQDLDWLNSRGVISINLAVWPLSQEEIDAALDNAKPSNTTDSMVLNRVQQHLQNIKAPVQISAYAGSQLNAMTSGFGQTEHDQRRASVAGQWQNPDFDVRLQANLVGGDGGRKPSHWLPANSYAAAKVGNQWLSFGQIPRYWGPGQEGSLILGDAARPVTAFSLQRAEQKPFETPLLSWLGRWQYQVFAGQLSQYDAIPNTKLIGMRVDLMPTDYLQLGAHRVFQWGGENRPQSLKSFGKAFLGKGENEESADKSNEPGNQIAGLDIQLKLQPLVDVPVNLYAQMVGEDEAGYFPSKKAYLFGIRGAHAWNANTINWSLEGADTRVEFKDTGIIYGHHLYRDGYYQQGLPLGYALGGDAQNISARLAVTTPDQQTFSGHVMHAKVNPTNQRNNERYSHNDTLNGVALGWEKTFKNGLNLGSQLWYVDSQNHQHDHGFGAGMKLSMPLR
ncbi:capsule assembly Wzi family protein [Paralysiella testudinis]|uniref:Capsule assembly Wzi family protein n=2 Tax=Paralysiella testudinis TaxID=2809020 RepID=A0A892ZNN7_9NEIS|nr:capsule assembly Wzi family protein [Paralysiella testudinis]